MKNFFILICTLVFTNTSVAHGIISAGPYLQNPSSNAITIMWHTTVPAYSWIEYGTDTLNLKKVHDVHYGIVKANNTDNKIRISGLVAGKTYYYRVCSQEIIRFEPYLKEFGEIYQSPFYAFKTFDDKTDSFTAVIFNDIHSKLPVFDKLVEKIAGIEYDFAVFNGDCFQDPKSKENELMVLQHFNFKMNGMQKPLFYLRGNHETRGAFAIGWHALFDWDGGNPYFAFTFGDSRFVLLDNGEDKRDEREEYSGLIDFREYRETETEWLKHEVESEAFKQANRRILIHHTPLYGWENEYDPGFIACKDLWDPIFRTTNFDIAINGHTHQYNFFVADSAGNPFPFVIGGGNSEKTATVLVLTKQGYKFNLKVIKIEGETDVFHY